ncbi:MAG TPA: hypothetical protein VM784_05320 [Actinomycetota bacterium]|nr:hypothetical protein [Actinomycetota bacterium]
MKIEAVCGRCERTFLLSQIGPAAEAPGRCPFCGAHFARHYTTVLVEAVEDAERSAEAFVASLGRLQAMETGFDIKIEEVLASVGGEVRAQKGEPVAGA